MQELMLQGTPSVVVIDAQAACACTTFGHLDDLRLGALLGQLVGEATAPVASAPVAPGCDDHGCARPDLPQS